MDIAERITSIVNRLELQPHPEGGFFRETYRCNEQFVPTGAEEIRNVSTAIYFLLTRDNFSAFHRIKSDEVWHHYLGDALEIHMITPDGEYELAKVGKKMDQGERPQFVVPAGTWFASRVVDGGSFGLAGCTVAPGFDFADFELAGAAELIQACPRYSGIIQKLTR